jgi:hypothetical protein
MCHCIEEIKQGLINRENENKKRKINFITYDLAYLAKGATLPIMTFHVSIEGKKRDEELKLVMPYCPFCGLKKYDEYEGDRDLIL